MNQELSNMALQIVELENSLQASEEFRAFLVKQKEIADQVANIKQNLKDKMLEFGIKKIESPNGKDDWIVSLSTATTIKADDISVIDDAFITLDEISGDEFVIQENRIYKKNPNTKLVKNLVDSGMALPDGFTKTITPRMSIKVNGKAV